MCEMKFSIEIGDESPNLIVRSGRTAEVVFTVPFKNTREIDHLSSILDIAKTAMAVRREEEK